MQYCRKGQPRGKAKAWSTTISLSSSDKGIGEKKRREVYHPIKKKEGERRRYVPITLPSTFFMTLLEGTDERKREKATVKKQEKKCLFLHFLYRVAGRRGGKKRKAQTASKGKGKGKGTVPSGSSRWCVLYQAWECWEKKGEKKEEKEKSRKEVRQKEKKEPGSLSPRHLNCFDFRWEKARGEGKRERGEKGKKGTEHGGL